MYEFECEWGPHKFLSILSMLRVSEVWKITTYENFIQTPRGDRFVSGRCVCSWKCSTLRTLIESHTSNSKWPSETHLRIPDDKTYIHQVRESIHWQEVRRGECCNKSGHDINRKRGVFVCPHPQKVKVTQGNVCYQTVWGRRETEKVKKSDTTWSGTRTTRLVT